VRGAAGGGRSLASVVLAPAGRIDGTAGPAPLAARAPLAVGVSAAALS
jgi:hypothetical protein